MEGKIRCNIYDQAWTCWLAVALRCLPTQEICLVLAVVYEYTGQGLRKQAKLVCHVRVRPALLVGRYSVFVISTVIRNTQAFDRTLKPASTAPRKLKQA